MSHWVFIFCTSFLLWARSCLGMGLSSFSSAPIFLYFWFVGGLAFLPCHFVASAMLLLNLCLWATFESALHFSLIQFMLPNIPVGLILIPSWASLAHFIPLGILDPLYSFGHPWPIPFLHSHGLFLHLLGVPSPITISFTFGVCWPLHQPHLLSPFFGLLRLIFTCFLKVQLVYKTLWMFRPPIYKLPIQT